jgi:hypothetical protein
MEPPTQRLALSPLLGDLKAHVSHHQPNAEKEKNPDLRPDVVTAEDRANHRHALANSRYPDEDDDDPGPNGDKLRSTVLSVLT